MASPSGRALTRKVLVLGEDTRGFLSVIRSLGRKGLTVDIAWCPPASPAARSRYVRARREIPPFVKGRRDWIEALTDLLAREDYDLVIPCNDQSIIPLQHHREEFARFPGVRTFDPETFADVFDKIRTNRLAASLGINLPAEAIVTEEAQFASAAVRAMGFPLVLKPKSSFTLGALENKSHVVKVRDEADLMRRGPAMLKGGGSVQVQRNFRGVGEGVEVLARDGAIVYAFQHRRLHEPPGGGGSSYRTSVALDPRLLEAAAKLMRALRYTGVAMVEFKVDPATRDWILIEINGRFWGSLPLAIAAGADFPWFYYQMAVEGRTEFPAGYVVGMRCRNLEGDMEWLMQNLSPGGARTEEHRERPLSILAKESLGLFAGKEKYDTLAWDDPGPGWADVKSILGTFGTRAVQKARFRFWQSGPGRRWAKARLMKRLRKARKLLFVCKGNICRSPFAAALASLRFPAAVQVASSGYYKVSGRPSPSEAVVCARGFGADLEAHRSGLLAGADLASADVVFVFDRDNFDRLRADFPGEAAKIFPLALAADLADLEIADPFGGEPEDYQAAYESISRCISALAPELSR